MNQNERIEIEVVLNDRDVLDALDRIIHRLGDLAVEARNITSALGNIDSSLTTTGGFIQRSIDNFDSLGAAIGVLDTPIQALITGLSTGIGRAMDTSIGAVAEFRGALVGGNGLRESLSIAGGAAVDTGAKLGAGKATGFGAKLLGMKGPIGLAVLALGGLWFAFRDTGDGSNEAGEDVQSFTDRLAYLGESLTDLEEPMERRENLLERGNYLMENSTAGLEDMEIAMRDLGMGYDSMTEQQRENHQELQRGIEYIREHGLTLGDLNEVQREVVMALSDTFNGYVDTLRNGNLEIATSNRTGAEEWEATMIRNQEIMTDWADNVDELCGRISEEMMDYIIALGPEYANRVQDMVNMSDDELAELEAVFLNNCQVAGRAALAGLDEAEIPAEVADLIFQSERTIQQAIRDADFQSIGLGVAEGLATGIGDGEHLVGTSASILARGCEDAMRLGLESNSPSRVFKRIGDDIVAGLVGGIENNQDQVTDVLETLGTAMGRVYNRTDRTFQNIGRDIMRGLNQGLLNGENSVMNTANRIANNIARTMRDALAINSPSRVMREGIGRFIPEGVAAGIDKYAGAAVDSVHKLGNDLINVNIPSVESMIGMGVEEKIYWKPVVIKLMYRANKVDRVLREIRSRIKVFYLRIKMKVKIKDDNRKDYRAKARVVLIPIAEPAALLQNRQQEPTPLMVYLSFHVNMKSPGAATPRLKY